MDGNWEAAPERERGTLEQALRRRHLQVEEELRQENLPYLLFSDLDEHCEGLCRLGDDYRILLKLVKSGCC